MLTFLEIVVNIYMGSSTCAMEASRGRKIITSGSSTCADLGCSILIARMVDQTQLTTGPVAGFELDVDTTGEGFIYRACEQVLDYTGVGGISRWWSR
jgi:hypothetical protein